MQSRRNMLRSAARLLAWSGFATALAIAMPPVIGDSQVVNSISIQRPPAEVFRYVTTPAHWPRWHPSSLDVSGAVDHSLGVGEQVREGFRVAGREGRVVWVVREAVPAAKWVIDGHIEGSRGRGTITYRIAPTPTGTRFEREFRYRMPNLLAAIVDKLVTEERIAHESAEALARLKATLEVQGDVDGA